jgi:hypothetical protein
VSAQNRWHILETLPIAVHSITGAAFASCRIQRKDGKAQSRRCFAAD